MMLVTGDLDNARLACAHGRDALSALGKRHTAHWPGAQAAEFGSNSCRQFFALPTTNHKATRRRLQSHLSGPSPHKTPPTKPLTFSFSSLIPTFYRPAASTVCTFYSSSSFYTPCARKLCISPTPVRSYASAKKKKMPPKKVVKEEKILLGRPGNSLTSGIVSESPAPHCRRVLTLTVVARSA
jgi:hypothetical protein